MKEKKNHTTYLIGILTVFIFACACGRPLPEEGTVTITVPPVATREPFGTEMPEPTTTSGPTGEEPLPTRQATQPPAVTLPPVATFTPTPEATSVPPVPTPEPTKEPPVFVTPEPTKEAAPSPTKEPTPVPTRQATPAPTEGAEPFPTKAPEETDLPILTPTINPLPFVHAGWQNVLDITMDHYIVFPECFDCSVTEQENSVLAFVYTSSTDENVRFSVVYTIGQAYREAAEEIYMRGGVTEEHLPDGKSFSYVTEEEDIVFRGWVIEEYYNEELLGEEYQNKEIPGTMRIEFSYPISLREQYETEEFRYYVVQIE